MEALTRTAAEIPREMLLIYGAVFLTAVFLALAVVGLVQGRGSEKRRLAAATVTGAAAGARNISLRPSAGTGLWQSTVNKLTTTALPKEEKRLSSARLRLMQAGYYSRHAIASFFVLRILLALALPVAVIVLLPLVVALEPQQMVTNAAFAVGIGYFGPSLWLSHRIDKRQSAMRFGFPDALDMLLICVEAGLSLNSAINRVAKEIGQASPLLAEQFELLTLELQAGVTRPKALRNMADRIGIEEINALVTLLNQSEAMGSSISASLRVYASEMRRKRMVKAEEKANKLPLKMTMPMVLFTLPSFMIVLLSPAVISIINNVLPAFGGK